MRGFLISLSMLLFAPMALADAGQIAAADRGPAVGSIIPSDLETIDQTGKSRHFEDLTGSKGLVLVFFRSAKWCGFCKDQLANLATGSDEITSRGYELVVLSYDKLKDIQKYNDEHQPGFPMLSDRKSKVIDAFGIRNEKYGKMHFANGVPHPMIFVIAPDKTIQAKLAEEGYKDRPSITVITETIDALQASAAP
ncbi:hypothetical protein MNBD_ALPHA06-2186 [hydrothermal vent metagenome]|uniref:thioredoxin-dependent peroxiredoxin n=1 Tax=hydrothermal vent metagenome TaxID=652676 RepID=A0A3B0S8C1_9ZZZZ